ncbi:hypothetical protein [Roseomonas sp. BN140053]|uniref:hypothetical protein n=1 Tax=Roseomonas sp. BN140053 TaxID=3391898 RepID=UPI0039E8FA55
MSCSAAHEMHELVHEAARPAVPGERVGAAIARAAKVLGLPYARARAHWYRLARQVTAEEADTLRARRRQLMIERAQQLEHEAAALRARYSQQDAA